MSFVGKSVIKGLRLFRDALQNSTSKLRDALQRPDPGVTVVRVGKESFKVRNLIATGKSSMGETLRAAMKWYKADQVTVQTEEMLESHKALVIRVWRFTDAPQVLQDMSGNGGDEDWVAVVPRSMAADIGWLESPAFGCYCIDKHEWGDYRVYIGCHA